MNSVMKGVSATVVFHLTDAEPMPSLLGPDARMKPDAVMVQFGDGHLASVEILGYIIGKKNQVTKRMTQLTLHPDDLPRYAPEPIRDLVTTAHNHLVTSAWSTGQGD